MPDDAPHSSLTVSVSATPPRDDGYRESRELLQDVVDTSRGPADVSVGLLESPRPFGAVGIRLNIANPPRLRVTLLTTTDTGEGECESAVVYEVPLRDLLTSIAEAHFAANPDDRPPEPKPTE